MKRNCILFFCMLWAIATQAQLITINLPHFAGKKYVWIVSEGEKSDTLALGILNDEGKTVLKVPQKYENRRGMSSFMLTDGGGFDLILNREGDFTAGSDVAQPTENEIYYTGSGENNFLLEYYRSQPALLNKALIMTAAVQAYKPDEPLYQPLLTEKQALGKRFDDMQRQNAESPLYAARIRQMMNYCNGINNRFDLTVQEAVEEQRKYVSEILDFGDLWSSGMWKTLFTRWMSVEIVQGDSILLTDSKAILAREQDRDMLATLSKKMVSLYNQYGKEDLLAQLFNSEDLLSPGHQAPQLALSDSASTEPLNSLVIFYESGCGNCENELLRLRSNYPVLQERNIRIISVSADTDEAVYRKNADLFPWQQKLCDYKGDEGVNFKNYAVVGTPTIFVIDGKGTITGRYARLSEFLEL